MVASHHLVLRDLGCTAANRRLLDGYSLDVPAGGIAAIVAPETGLCQTLADLVAGFERLQQGHIEIDGRDLALRGPGRRGIMSVRAELALFPGMSGETNIAFPLEQQQRHNAAEIKRRVQQLAEAVGIGDAVLTALPTNLPPEQQIRLALARALAAEPQVLLLERPLNGLSVASRLGFLPELRRLLRQFKLTTLLVTDDLNEAMVLADDISVVMNGSEVQKGSADSIYKRPGNVTIARLAGACNLVPVAIEAKEGQIIIRASILQGGQAILPDTGAVSELKSVDAVLMVRPEAVRLFLGIRRFDVLAEGVIADVMPHGNGAQIRVTLDQYPRGMLAEVPLPAPMPLEIGRRATLGWNREDCHLLPPEPLVW